MSGRPSAEEMLLDALRPLVAELVDEELARRELESQRVEWLTVEEYAQSPLAFLVDLVGSFELPREPARLLVAVEHEQAGARLLEEPDSGMGTF
jgi:hypothetical protein